jgi:hypothetical protein
MDPLLALGLFVGIPVGLAALIAIAVVVPRGYRNVEPAPEGQQLITSSPALPNPAAVRSSATPEMTGGAHGNW